LEGTWGMLATDAALAFGAAGLVYLRNYVAFSSATIKAKTTKISRHAQGQVGALSQSLEKTFDEFTELETVSNQPRGRFLNKQRLILNKLRRDSELPPLKLFEDIDENPTKVSCGILFSNSVALRDYKQGFPLEMVTRGLYDAVRSSKGISTCLCAYDKDLHIIQTFEGSYDVSKQGILPKERGYHAWIDSAMKKMHPLFDEAECIDKILYVITGPINNHSMSEGVKQQIAHYESSGIQIALIYIDPSRKDIKNPLTENIIKVDHTTLSSFRRKLRKLNEKLAERIR
jgi:hypothetical protein